ncbi:unnamed protein product [Cylindrotheca closterium]|uniref:Uncharacterized protein n=1 Tax=Cylindrotheca closterium TaxID=2856 RepID=A0AAD2FFP9_9STRA|nr:unnamed protein product [Cylindrotheca closterium]
MYLKLNRRQIKLLGYKSYANYPLRRLMIAVIFDLLRRRRPDAPARVARIFPLVAQKMEHWMFAQSSSRQEYSDLSTLTSRMAQYARMTLERAGRLHPRLAKAA